MSDEDKTVFIRQGADAPVPAAPPGGAVLAKLICLDNSLLATAQKGLVLEITEQREQVLGRDRHNPLFIDSSRISRKHAAIAGADDGWSIRDLNSTNGLWVNGIRVGDARLKTGDMIKLGVVPFRFEIARPVAAAEAAALARFSAMEGSDSEKTMMFGDVRASSKLLEAQETKDGADAGTAGKKTPPGADKPAVKPVVRPAVKPAVKRVQPAKEDETTILELAVAAPRARFPLAKTVFYALIAVIIAGGGYLAVGMFTASNIVESKRDAVSRFVREAAAIEDPERFAEERKTLAELKLSLVAAIAAAPDKAELGVLLERVTMLEFERNFYDAMTAANFSGARTAIDATRRKVAGLKPQGASGRTEGENLLAAMEPSVALREFAKAFPDPQQKSAMPARAQLDELLRQKTEFTKVQRAVNMDLVRHPFLGRLLDQGAQDIRLLERWELALRAAATK